MTDALTADQRTKLARLIGNGRALLEQDLTAQASGRFGIDKDGTIATEEALRLDEGGIVARREIVEVVEHLRSEGDSAPDAIARLLREAVFTHLNRLVAIRIAEALGLLPESLARGDRSQGYREVRELAPLLAADDTNGYWTYLQLCGDELARDVPNLFDPRNPLLALTPSPGALRNLVKLFANSSTSDLWTASDCLGWTYQFFNTAEERRAMREASQAPRDSRELAVRNQFFTPRYVVDFLVQNSLGRRLLDAEPTSPLIDDLPFLVDPPTEQGTPVELQDVAVLDPACGSGHFLLAAYDLLERAWQHKGVPPREAAEHIVRSLWGIDIDPRCVQVASAAIIFRARRSRPTGSLPRPNVICARSLPATATGLKEVIRHLSTTQRSLIKALTGALQNAPLLGPLLRVERHIEDEIRAAIAGTAEGSLANAIEPKMVKDIQDELLKSLETASKATTATPAERLLAAEADDGVRFVVALLRRYDAVFQNPPFGEPIPETKPYLKAAYPWMPSRDCNLLAAFIGRGAELCQPGVGYVGAITSRTGMFLKTYENWRQNIILRYRLVTLADLGYGVMEGAQVEAAAYVLRNQAASPEHETAVVRLLKDTDKAAGIASATANQQQHKEDDRIFNFVLNDLQAVPGSPLAYWMSPTIRRLFRDHLPVEGRAGEVRQGVATGDDFRFVRAFWEVNPSGIACTREETVSGRRWVPLAKGGDYSPYWADIHLVIDYSNDGSALREYPGSVIRNPQYYFRPGFTWPGRTTSGFGPRVLPTGTIFSHTGHSLFPLKDAGAVLGMLTSRLTEALLAASLGSAESTKSGSPAKSYYVGIVQSLPWLAGLEKDADFSQLSLEVAALRRSEDLGDETTRLFIAPRVMADLLAGKTITEAAVEQKNREGDCHLRILDLTYRAERIIHDLAELDHDAEDYLNTEVGPHPASYRHGPVDEHQLRTLLREPIPKIINRFIEGRGGSPAIVKKAFFADRRLEVVAHGLECAPKQIEDFRRERGILPAGERKGLAAELLSYLVGISVGRWDLRVAGAAPSMGDLFDPTPVYPPGMLLDGDLPPGSTPTGYPLELPPGQLLIDQLGHPWDIVHRLATVAASLVKDGDQLLSDIMKHLKGKDLRGHMRKHFFKDHLSRYTKSRRKAPIYWPLYVPSGLWGVWIYAPAINRETIYAVEAAAAARLNAATIEISHLLRDQRDGGSGRSPRQLAVALATEQRLAEELRTFREEAERIAGLGWEPNLDDGILLCAAPLAELFPAWAEAAKARRSIKAGQFQWATVSRWMDQL